MEALSFLKKWRTTRGATTVGDSNSDARGATKTMVSAAAIIPYFSDGEDGSYFDLEFAIPDNIDKTNEEDEVSDSENEDELKFAVLSNEENVKLSLSDEHELFISSDNLQEFRDNSEDNSKSPVPKSKFWVLLLKLKKQKSGNGVLEKSENMEKNDEEEDNGDDGQENSAGRATPKIEEKQGKAKGKFFTVKFNVEEVKLPLVSMFARDLSKENNNDKEIKADDERKLTKEMLQKYFKMVKPLYFHVTKNYVGKLKRSGMPRESGAVPHTCSTAEKGGEVVEVTAAASGGMKRNNQKQGNNSSNLQAGLKVVRKQLGKIRSASGTVAVATPGKAVVVPDRRDDSMLQVQDGIQGAILHCKRSFNSSNDEDTSSTCGSVQTASTPHI